MHVNPSRLAKYPVIRHYIHTGPAINLAFLLTVTLVAMHRYYRMQTLALNVKTRHARVGRHVLEL